MELADALTFIKSHKLAVVATIGKANVPQAAVVEFGELPDMTIIIDTLKSSRKYRNLQANPNVAIVIGWDKDKTVQIDAKAHELRGSDLARAKTAYFSKNKRAEKWANREDIAYFAFKPTWLRYSDLGQEPWLVEEFELNRE